jgi:hypothetical protein
MSGVVSTVARFFLDNGVAGKTAKDIAAGTGLTKPQVFNAVHYLCQIGALAKQEWPDGRMASVFVIADRAQLERRTDGRARKAFSEELLDEAPPLTFFIDGDGDLQLVRDGEDPVLIRNADARRLVAFVATQATAILTGGTA